jgi:hypothetical protein
MSSYHNALSDRLVVCHFPTCLLFTVYNKDLVQKYQMISPDLSFPDSLADAIFSETHLLRMLNKCTLAPLGEQDYAPYFFVNFGGSYSIATQDSELFTLVYEDTPTDYTRQLVNPRITTDIDITYRFASQGGHANAVYFYHVENEVTILAWKDGKFVLANRYAADNEEELFYYVMLVVDQLELPPTDIHFSVIGTKQQHASYHLLFKKYLSPLYLCNREQVEGTTDTIELAHFFGKCVL